MQAETKPAVQNGATTATIRQQWTVRQPDPPSVLVGDARGNDEALRGQGIQDITEGLQFYAPPTERKHHLLLVRGHLYAVVGQFKRAAEDYRAILDFNPANRAAWEALKKLTVSHGS